MRRLSFMVLVVAFTAMVPMAASVVAAQPYPGTGAKTVLGGNFSPGGAGSLNIGGATPNTVVAGTIFSAPIAVSATSNASGVVSYTFAVPADFALNSAHAILFADGDRLDFCVNSSGAVAPCSQLTGPTTVPGSLPVTGSGNTDDMVKIGAAAVAVGGLLILWRRRRPAIS